MKSRFLLLLGIAGAALLSRPAGVLAQEPPVAPQEQKAAADEKPAPPVAVEAAPAEPAQPEAKAAPAPKKASDPATTKKKSRGSNRSTSPVGNVRVTGRDDVKVNDNHLVEKGRTINGKMITVMGEATLDGVVKHDMVTIMGGAVVNGTVEGKVVTLMGDVTINGTVRGKVIAVMGDVELGENGRVDGDILCKGGEVRGATDANVGGKIIEVGANDDIDLDEIVTPAGEWWDRALRFGRPLAFGAHLGWLWVFTAFTLGFYFLLALAFPRGIRKCGDVLVQRPVATVLTSILGLLALPVVFVLLCVTVIGIPIAFICLPIAVAMAVLFGRAAIYALLGRAFTKDRYHPAFALILGALIFIVLYLVPVLGLTLSLFVALIGFGSVLVAVFGPSATPAAATAGGAPMPPGGRPVPPRPATPPPPSAPSAAPSPVPPAPVAPLTVVEPSISPAASSVPPPPSIPVPPEIPAPAQQSPGFGAVSPAPVPPPSAPTLPVAPVRAAVPPVAWETLPRAGFWQRAGAMMIDLLIVVPLCAPWAGPVVIALVPAYCAIFWQLRGTTIGGIICGLKVVRMDGREVDWPVAVVRALGCFVSLAVAGLGFVWVVFDEEKQSWHDKIAGTVVVRAPKGMSLL